MNKANRIFAAVCCLLAAALYLAVPSQVSAVSTTSSTLGADFFPKLVAFLLFLSGAGLLIQSHCAIRGDYEMEESPVMDWRSEAKAAVSFIMIILYVTAMPMLGFVISSTAFGAAALLFLGKARWWHYAVHAVCVLAVNHVFSELLYIWLPTFGRWGI